MNTGTTSIERVLASFDGAKSTIESQAERLHADGVRVVTILDETYPQQLQRVLGRKAPKFLFYKGNLGLADRPNLGFCGSRKASERGLDVCEQLARSAIEAGAGITAGYAAGIDQQAHRTALEALASTIVVLPEGISNFSIRANLRPSWDWSRVLVVSEFLPGAGWSAARAMQRNRTIIGFSNALVVIEAGESGGTFEAGKSALALKHPVFAPLYSDDSGLGPGNKILIGRGAKPIFRGRISGRPKTDEMLQALRTSPTEDRIQELFVVSPENKNDLE